MYSETVRNVRKQTKNPNVKHMMKISYDVNQYLKAPHTLSPYSPVWGINCFVPGRADATFKLVESQGLKMIQYLYLADSNVRMSFEEMGSKLNIDIKKKTFIQI